MFLLLIARLEKYRKHRLLPTNSMDQGPKRLIATLLVVDSLQHLLLLSPSSCFSELMVLSGYPGG